MRGKGFSAAQGRRVSNRAIVDAGVGPLSSRDAAAFSQSSKGKYATASRKRTSAQPRLGFRTRPLADLPLTVDLTAALDPKRAL